MAIVDKPSEEAFLIDADGAQDDQVMHLEETGNLEQETQKYQGIINHVESRFTRTKERRSFDERRWLKAYQNFRGIYGPEVVFRDDEKSQVFVKVTKTKVLAAYAQISDVLFSTNKFPLGIEATPMPEGIDKYASMDVDPTPAEQKPTPTVARPDILKSITGPLKQLKEEFSNRVWPGAPQSPTEILIEPAAKAAKRMQDAIHDQLEESQSSKHLRSVVLEMCLMGTGILKGPFTERKTYPKWTKDGAYEPVEKIVPKINSTSVWNFYPDPDARNIKDCEFVIERHKMSKTELRQLKKNATFRPKSIDEAIEIGTNYTPEYWEHTIDDSEVSGPLERYEVLEYWGSLDAETAKEDLDFTVPDELKDKETLQINIWICNGQILRFIINPFTPERIPYHAVPYEINPYSFFGVGVAENMEDTQLLMNGFMRLAVDNAALSGNVMFEVDETTLAPGQDFKIYPGKVWRRNGGAPGQSIFGTTTPNVSQETLMMFDKARQLADEATGMPSYSHGGVGVAGVGRTASGMSMLMGAAAQNIKSVVQNIDDYLLAPLGKAFFAFNMQFNFSEEYTEGDLEVVALGTTSLMRNEVKSQKLMQLMQLGANPMIAPMLRWDTILKDLAGTLDLDEEKFVNDPAAAQIQALRMAEFARAQQPQQDPMAQGGPPGVQDPTGNGNGNIAPGQAPPPGAQGFSGGGGMNGGGAQANAQAAQQQQGGAPQQQQAQQPMMG